ncbi:hypothetical protein F2Q70_00002421 [Brassica cretica]|nr:hypothetical protein F2Q70_00002421 [Brassica cretica]
MKAQNEARILAASDNIVLRQELEDLPEEMVNLRRPSLMIWRWRFDGGLLAAQETSKASLNTLGITLWLEGTTRAAPPLIHSSRWYRSTTGGGEEHGGSGFARHSSTSPSLGSIT